jgi:hypothetical protein
MGEDLSEILEKLKSIGDRPPSEVRIGKRAGLGKYRAGDLIGEDDGMRVIYDPQIPRNAVAASWGAVQTRIFI